MSHTVYVYQETAKVGAWGADQVKQRFLASGWKVDDVQGDPFFQGLDVDLLVESPHGKVSMVEVKADRYPPKNVYLETVSNVERGTPGCMVYTASDWIAYYFVRTGVAIMIPTRELQTWMLTHLTRYPAKTVKNRSNIKERSSYGRPVPLADLLAALPGCYVVRDLPRMVEAVAA